MTSEETEALLIELMNERAKFTRSDRAVMEGLITKLVEGGIYPSPTPAMVQHNYSYLQMVEGWGAYWYRWDAPIVCPKCVADWRDPAGPPFRRCVIIISGRTRTIECPDCHARSSVTAK